MITEEAKAEVFWLAFKGLPKKEQQLVVQKLLQDREFVEDLMDIAIIEQRRSELNMEGISKNACGIK